METTVIKSDVQSKAGLSGLTVTLLILAISLSIVPVAQAQYYFGKNKIQYTSFDWQVMTTEHFRVYFYTGADKLARVAGHSAERAYDSLSTRFNHEISKKIPLIIYSAPAYFGETNVLPYILPESVAGFTEYMKGRVVVPFFGSYFRFSHVIKHELVHVFTRAKLTAVLKGHIRPRYARPPLWFTEGLAEYWSTNWDSEGEMTVKDMVLGGQILPVTRFYQVGGSFMVYKLGQSVCEFINDRYGEDKILRLFENWHKAKRFDQLIKLTLGDDLAELSRKWEYYLKKKYYPVIESEGLPSMEADQLTYDGYAESAVPIRWDDGQGEQDWIVFKANRLGYSGIYMKLANSSKGGWKTLLKGERSADFESLHLLRSSIDANSRGQVIFSSKSSETDVLNLYDLTERKVIRHYRFDDLISTRSPSFSSDGTQAVFVGVSRSGWADLYLLDLVDGGLKRLTDDTYADRQPVFSQDDKRILFSSDRGPYGEQGALNIFELDLNTLRLTPLTFGNHRDVAPEDSRNGLYFSSNRNGSYNIYCLTDDDLIIRQSTFATGAFTPKLSPDNDQIVFTAFQNRAYRIFQMEIPLETDTVLETDDGYARAWAPPEIQEGQVGASTVKYDTDYSFDIAQSSIAYDPVYGSLGGIQVAMSDVLGNKAWYFLMANTASNKDELLSSFNIGLTYINKENRINWGVGAFHLYDEHYNDFDYYYDEREAGAIGLLSYPLSKFHRVEFTTLVKYSKRERRFGLGYREDFLLTHYFRWIFDNSLWDFTGPLEGRRYNLSLGVTYSGRNAKAYNRVALADIRHYFRLGKYSAFANRLFIFASNGSEPDRIYLGGSWSLRGYSRRWAYNRNVLLASTEIRYPLIDALVIGFPFGAMGFQGIRGALFFDVGTGWEDEFDQLYGSFGTGVRVALGYVVVLRFDFSRTTDFRTISQKTDFDFFFGWNF